LVLAFVLTRVAKINVPHYPVFIFAGIVGWTYFSATVTTGATSIVDNSALSSRIYFPRAILPLAACLSNVFALGISVALLLIVAVVAGETPGLHTLYLIPACLLIFALAVSLTLVLSALHVYFRDTKFAVQAAILVWFYVTPIFYPLTLLHGWTRTLVKLNPVTGAVELFHAGALGGASADWVSAAISLGWIAALTVLGLTLQCRYDRVFADLL
jgi:ABC-type polysaccharide/polyol phosphate export permease